MAAYLIFTRERMRDEAEYEIYKEKARVAGQGHHFIPHVQYGKFEVLEGPDAQGVVVLEFASAAEAKAYYNSPAYIEARKYRQLGADYRVILVEGITRQDKKPVPNA
jgi:uncharacterized protein (DUF1330 family)